MNGEELKVRLSLDLSKAKTQLTQMKKEVSNSLNAIDDKSYKAVEASMENISQAFRESTASSDTLNKNTLLSSMSMGQLQKMAKLTEVSFRLLEKDMKKIYGGMNLAKDENPFEIFMSELEEYKNKYDFFMNAIKGNGFIVDDAIPDYLDSLTARWGYVKEAMDNINQSYDNNEAAILRNNNMLKALAITTQNNIEAIKGLADEMAKGNITAEEFRDRIDKINNTANPGKVDDFATAWRRFRRVILPITLAVAGLKKLFNSIMEIDLSSLSKGVRGGFQELQQNIQRMKMDLQQAAISFINTFGPIINTIVKGIDWIANAIKSLFGSVGGSFNKTTKSIDTSTKSIQKMKREAMGFDELNILPGKDSGGGGGGSSLTEPDASKGKKGTFIDFAKTLGGFASIYAIVKTIKGMIQNGFTLGGLAKIGGIILLFEGLKLTIEGIIGLFKNEVFSKEWWNSLGDTLIGIGLAIAGVLLIINATNLVAWIVAGVVLLAGIIIKYRDWVWSNVLKPVIDFFKNCGETIWGGIKAYYQFWIDLFTTVATWVWDNVLKPVIDFFKKCGETIWNSIKVYYQFWIDLFKTIANWVYDNVITPVINHVKGLWNKLKSGAQNLWDGVKSIFGAVSEWVQTKIITPVVNKFNTLKDKIKSIFTDIKDGVKGILNKLINPLNKAVDKINKIQFDVPDWVPVIGGKKWGFNVPKIPELATGGITNGSVLANIGEAGREAVLPLENNTEWMDILADRIASRGQQKVVLNVDGRQLGFAAISSINGITAETGNLPLRIM